MKDAKGHGSNKRPIPGHPYHSKTDAELHYIVRDAAAARDAMQGHSPAAENKYADQVNDASTVLGYRARGGKSDAPADVLASGPKSDPVPTHDAMRNSSGHVYGSPEALADYKREFGGPRDFKAEARSFNSGKREIARLKRQGK